MAKHEPTTLSTISVFTRHSPKCPERDNAQWKRCHCMKSLYIYENGRKQTVSAKTRSWAQAERAAEEERKKRDPVEIKLRKIAEKEAAKEAAEKAAEAKQLVPLAEALEQWLAGMKFPGKTSVDGYRSTTRTMLKWAKREQVVHVSDLTPALLDRWRASWSPDAEEPENRLALTTQAARLTRIKAFCKWALGMEYTKRNPTLTLKAITPDESQTWPTTPAQFEQLLAATYTMDAEARHQSARLGQHLRALFLVQRWTGLRAGDVLILPKSDLQGNRLTATIRKIRNRRPEKCRKEFILPENVVEALIALPRRKEEHPDYFFWSRTCGEVANVNKWLRKVDRLNGYLSFQDEAGEPMEFRTHMLRDMCAVEMLLEGVSIEIVSKLLTHESVTMTERYYGKWTARRRQQHEDVLVAAMRRMGATITV
jgi:site-specific recombinase XerD